MNNIQPPLAEPVLQLLQNQLANVILSAIPTAAEQSLTEQYLMSRLGLKLTSDNELSPDLQRFQQHFVLYHVLYRLQTHWLSLNKGFLSIGLAKVTLFKADLSAAVDLSERDGNSGRREYYSNWQHFYAMSEQLLDEYLQQFWQYFSQGAVSGATLSTEQAQQLLNLNPGFSLVQLKKAYRSQALLFHPDRAHGQSEKFIDIRQAYQLLLQQFH